MNCCMNWSQCLRKIPHPNVHVNPAKLEFNVGKSRTNWEWIQAKFRIPQRSCHPCPTSIDQKPNITGSWTIIDQHRLLIATQELLVHISEYQIFKHGSNLFQSKSQKLHQQIMEPWYLYKSNPQNIGVKKNKTSFSNPIWPHVYFTIHHQPSPSCNGRSAGPATYTTHRAT